MLKVFLRTNRNNGLIGNEMGNIQEEYENSKKEPNRNPRTGKYNLCKKKFRRLDSTMSLKTSQ